MSVPTMSTKTLIEDLTEARRRVTELESQAATPFFPAIGFRPTSDSKNQRLFVISGVDAEGRFLFVDRQGAINLQRPAEEIVGTSIHDYFSTEEADKYLTRIRRVIAERETLVYEDLVQIPSGARWYSTVIHPLTNEHGQTVGAHVISHDITDRKQAQAAITERLQFEQLITELASDFVNLAEADVDRVAYQALKSIGSFMDINRCLIFSFSDDYEYLNCRHEWHAADVPGALGRLQRQPRRKYDWLYDQLIRGTPVVIPQVARLSDDAATVRDVLLENDVQSFVSVPMRVGGRTVGSLALDSVGTQREWSDELVGRLTLVGDIIAGALERVSTERKLAESRQFVQGITEATPYIVFLFDLIEERVTYVNQQITHSLGYTPQELAQLGSDAVAELMHPDDLESYRETIASWRLADDDQYTETEFRIRRQDGEWRFFRFCGRIFTRGVDQSARQLICIAQDATDRKQAEEELQSHREQLAHVSRLSTMGEMVAGIAHEISQPLYAILNFAKASRNVLRDENKKQDIDEWLGRIIRAASQSGEIINRLRNFARDSEHHLQTENLDQVIEEAVELVQFETRRRRVQLEIEPSGATVRVDKVQIEQVLVNLLQNAMEAMEATPETDRLIQIRCAPEDNQMVRIDVVDRGAGLPSDPSTIFDPFVTTKSSGMGMGLAISQTIIETHGGRLSAAPDPSGGTRISFTIPAGPTR